MLSWPNLFKSIDVIVIHGDISFFCSDRLQSSVGSDHSIQ